MTLFEFGLLGKTKLKAALMTEYFKKGKSTRKASHSRVSYELVCGWRPDSDALETEWDFPKCIVGLLILNICDMP